MGSKRTRCPLRTARIKAAIISNKKLSFFLSALLLSILYQANTTLNSSPSNKRRFGVGGRDASGELASALRRRDDGRAAVVIVRVIGLNGDQSRKDYNPHSDVKSLVQVKSHDYPIHEFRGAVCLLGGNANKYDATPLDTLKRELNEELNNLSWINDIDEAKVIDHSSLQLTQQPMYNSTIVPLSPSTIRYLGVSLHSQTAELIHKSRPYSFLCALFEITLRADQLPPSVLYPRGVNVQEGQLALLSEDQWIWHAKYAWGYGFTVRRYFGRNTTNICEGTSVEDVDESVWNETVWTPLKRRL